MLRITLILGSGLMRFKAYLFKRLQYYFGKQMSEEPYLDSLNMTATDIGKHIQQIDASATSSAGILRSVADYTDTRFRVDEIQGVFVQTLIDNSEFYSIYFASPNEFFFKLSIWNPLLL